MAVLAAVLLGGGVLRHYRDIYLYKTVRGISFIFVGLDAAGDLFSLCAVCTISLFGTANQVLQPTVDVLGVAIYATELFLWIGIMACGIGFCLWRQLYPEARDQRADERSQRDEGIVLCESLMLGEIGGGTFTLHALSSTVSVFSTSGSQRRAGFTEREQIEMG